MSKPAKYSISLSGARGDYTCSIYRNGRVVALRSGVSLEHALALAVRKVRAVRRERSRLISFYSLAQAPRGWSHAG